MSGFDVTKLPRNMREKILPCETHSFGGSQCWEWIGATNSRGYGSVTAGVKGKTLLAHRRAYMEVVGPIPGDLTIDHLCQNKVCVNTDHLEVVTRRENILRATRTRTHCQKGHPLSGANLYLKQRPGYVNRVCRKCNYEYGKAYRARKRAEREQARVYRAVVPSD